MKGPLNKVKIQDQPKLAQHDLALYKWILVLMEEFPYPDCPIVILLFFFFFLNKMSEFQMLHGL